MRDEVIEELRDCRRRVAPLSHLAQPSLSHYAALSFVVIGGGQSLSWGLRDEVIPDLNELLVRKRELRKEPNNGKATVRKK